MPGAPLYDLAFDIRDGVSMEEMVCRVDRDLPKVMKTFNIIFKETLWQLTQNLRLETRLWARDLQLRKIALRSFKENQAGPMQKGRVQRQT